MRLLALSAAPTPCVAPAVLADDPVTIGVLLTLSGPPAVLGEHARDGVLLARKALGGKVGGREARIIVIDDEGKPDAPRSSRRSSPQPPTAMSANAR
ncbi:ABC transporter substrate-binding protein [Paracoccus sp. YIM 132242]|uniref:ABC transporter substrate-binding protein n=1 Tax=Paracoccus lichenicola TaxID=2665644 RepID=A0A6L6HR21_9RHOB|nr:ABC transporter substrate-binding protein [Paracoccus lichenicola]MTE01587.1 ABC transporter substrate-binding protein [Paracoccus lichenicola]